MRFAATWVLNRIILICAFATLISCRDRPAKNKLKTHSIRFIHPKGSSLAPNPKGFILWISQDGSYVVLVLFKKDTNHDGRVDAKMGEHGELLADKPTYVWMNTITNEEEDFDAFMGSDSRKRLALLKKEKNIFLMDTREGRKTLLKGAEAKADPSNPCLPSREAVLNTSGTRLVFPISKKSYRALDLEKGTEHDVNTAHLLWRVRPLGEGEEVFEIVKDRNGDGLHFPESLSTCACSWCPRFARSVGSYGSRGDEIRKSIYYKGKVLKFNIEEKECRGVGQTQGHFQLLECRGSLFRKDIHSGEKRPLSFRFKIPSYENPTIDGWYPVLALDKEGLQMARYSVEKNILERGPHVKQYAKKNHSAGYWLGISNEGPFVWELRSNRSRSIKGLTKITTLNGLIINTSEGKYLVNGLTGTKHKVSENPTLSNEKGCAVYAQQTHRLGRGPWEILCFD